MKLPDLEMEPDVSGTNHIVAVPIIVMRNSVFIIPYTGVCGDGKGSSSEEFEFFIGTGW